MKDIELNKAYAVMCMGGSSVCLAKQKGGNVVEEFFSSPLFGIGGNGGHAEFAVVNANMLVPVVCVSSSAVASEVNLTLSNYNHQLAPPAQQCTARRRRSRC